METGYIVEKRSERSFGKGQAHLNTLWLGRLSQTACCENFVLYAQA
jgi:hypothetical protein